MRLVHDACNVEDTMCTRSPRIQNVPGVLALYCPVRLCKLCGGHDVCDTFWVTECRHNKDLERVRLDGSFGETFLYGATIKIFICYMSSIFVILSFPRDPSE